MSEHADRWTVLVVGGADALLRHDYWRDVLGDPDEYEIESSEPCLGGDGRPVVDEHGTGLHKVTVSIKRQKQC